MQDPPSQHTPAEIAGDDIAPPPVARCHVLELASNDHLTSVACLMQELHLEMTERYADDSRFVECFLNRRHCERELKRLPGAYAAPAGAILIALCGGEDLVGCVALRSAGDDACELQRLYVRPARRRRGFGRALVESALTAARARGYRLVQAVPMDAQWEARVLLRSLDFEDDASTTGHALSPNRRWQLMELDFQGIMDQADPREQASESPAGSLDRAPAPTETPPTGVAQRP